MQEPDLRLRAPHLYRALRPELVRTLDYALCSDGFSRFVQNEQGFAQFNADLVRATKELMTSIIPACSTTLDQVWRGSVSPLLPDASLAALVTLR